ncbi:MAG: glutaminyl-peptide cyclotransferase [Flavipsychrobacter sp.]|jgi:glutamine cyclotransferase|nr:glutaminyl-peptide cyclotransferase [Flavipsychrobacter sp.]
MKPRLKFTAIALLPAMICLLSCKGQHADNSDNTDSASEATPTPMISYTLVKEYPHDPAAFTEGLEYIDGHLYESVGRYGQSDLRKTDLVSGKIIQQQKMDNRYFGEGITVLNGKIYQLTYQEKTGFIYDQKTFKQLGTFPISTAEGWGMTNDGSSIIYGDGSNNLYFLDPITLKETKRISVTDNYGPVSNINELEYINDHIYANQWQTDLILKINPNTGKVVGQVNLGDLRSKTNIPRPIEGNESAPEHLNGIAYDKQGNRIFITGKNWPKLFEIKLDN